LHLFDVGDFSPLLHLFDVGDFSPLLHLFDVVILVNFCIGSWGCGISQPFGSFRAAGGWQQLSTTQLCTRTEELEIYL
jgi:hypothetical protein